MSQFRLDGRTLVAAVPFVTGNTSLATADHGLDIDAGILYLFQRENLQYLMLLRVADVQVSVSRRDAQIILICHLRRAERDEIFKWNRRIGRPLSSHSIVRSARIPPRKRAKSVITLESGRCRRSLRA